VLRGIRPRQFTKNGVVFLAMVFTVGLAWQPSNPNSWLPLLGRSLLAFAAFSMVSAGEYLVNDAANAVADRLHPRKRHRPAASQELEAQSARLAALPLFAAGLLMSLPLGPRFEIVLVLYGVISLAYTYALKHVVLIDVAAVASGFVLRAVGGAAAIGVPISPWLYVCTSLGALLLALGKRRHELLELGAMARFHRPVLGRYSLKSLDRLSLIVAVTTVAVYSAYTVSAARLPANHAMVATVPFVALGVARYLYVSRRRHGGNPDEVLVRDPPLLTCILIWVATAGALLAIFR
jgi:4-hydroxybenzoate polyprenyltransferase